MLVLFRMIRNREELESERVEIDLTGPDGNALVLLGIATRWAYVLGYEQEEIKELLDEMKSGDYENLITVFDREFGHFCDLYR